MSFDAYELSTEDGRPTNLYSFTLGTRRWCYTSSAEDVMTADGRVWKAAAISDDGVKQTGESASDALTITVPTDIAPVQLFITSPPSSPMSVSILLKHDDDAGIVVAYVGELAQISFPEPGKAVITCETISASMRREGLRLAWQRACPYVLYDPLTCKAPKVPLPCIVTAISGYTVVVGGIGGAPITMLDGQFNGGFLAWTHPVKGLEYMAIEANQSNVLTIFGMPTDLYQGQQIIAYKGCARTPDACQSFGNYANYGGYPAMPGKSPFDGLSAPVF